MSAWRTVTRGLRSLFRRDEVERELDDELRHWIEQAAHENVRRGMSPEAAERSARAAAGGHVGVETAKTDVRTAGWEAWADFLRQDARVAVRGLRRTPAFTLVAVASLALGIGATTTMFSVVNAVLFRPLPYRDAGRLALIYTDDTRRGLHRELTAYSTITDWQTRSRAFEEIAFFSRYRIALQPNGPGQPRGRAQGSHVSGNLFSLLGASPILGRLIADVDLREQASVVVISHGFWQRWFGGDSNVIGRTFAADDGGKGGTGTRTVIGVLPPSFYFPDRQTEVYMPATTYERFERESVERFPSWARRWHVVGRLASAASVDDARAEMAHVGRDLAATHGTDFPDFPGFGTTVVPLLDSVAGTNLQSGLWLLLGAVGLVLLVVCTNIASLLLARGAARQREFAVRSALGAGRARILRQLLVETGVLVLAAGTLGVTIAAAGTPALARAASAYVPRMDEVALDWRVLAFAAAIAAIAGLAFGLVPALRLSSTDANETLREGGRGTGAGRLRRSQGALVLAESALALMLLMGAGLLLRSLDRLGNVDPGFDPVRVLTMRLEFAPDAFPSESRAPGWEVASARMRERWMMDFLTRLESLPGVESAAFIDDLYLNSQGNESITIPGQQPVAGELTESVASPGFFRAMRVPLRRGRYLVQEDAQQKIRALWTSTPSGLPLADQARVALAEPVVVNEAFARRFFPGQDPVGKRFCTDPTNRTYWYEIVGVVADMRRSGLERAATAEYYGPYYPVRNGRVDLLVRAAGDPLALAGTVRAEVARAMPSILIVNVSTADAGLGDFTARRRMQTWLLTAFAALALGLAALGIFGLTHYAVVERTREIGVRVALGATPRDVLRLIVAQGMRMPVIGIIVGLAMSAALTKVIANQLYDVQPTDPATFVLVALVLALVAASACYLAARRAAAADPVRALRDS